MGIERKEYIASCPEEELLSSGYVYAPPLAPTVLVNSACFCELFTNYMRSELLRRRHCMPLK